MKTEPKKEAPLNYLWKSLTSSLTSRCGCRQNKHTALHGPTSLHIRMATTLGIFCARWKFADNLHANIFSRMDSLAEQSK